MKNAKNDSSLVDEKFYKFMDDNNTSSYSIQDTVIDVLNLVESEYRNNLNQEDGLKTGFGKLTFLNDELIILTSGEYGGKTVFALNLIRKIAVENKESVGLIIPGNYKNVEIGGLLLSMLSKVNSSKIRSGMLGRDDLEKVQNASGFIFESPIFLFNESNCTLEKIKQIVKELVEEYKIKLLVIENIEFIRELVESEKDEYRINLELIIFSIKELATTFHIPIVLVTPLPQPNDVCEPKLDAFRKYMFIPNIADKVLLIQRKTLFDIKYSEDTVLLVAEKKSWGYKCIDMKYFPTINLFVNAPEE